MNRSIISAVYVMLLCAGRAWADVVLIHHPDLASEPLTAPELTRIYAMQKKVWANGVAVVPLVQSRDGKSHKEFANAYLHMQPYQLERLWHRLVFSGTGGIPAEVNSDDAMWQRVKSTPGAIGYVSLEYAANVDGAMKAVVIHEQ